MGATPERLRGDLWAAKLRREGCLVRKVPAWEAGVPDWMVVAPVTHWAWGMRLVEAKQLQAKGSAFVPSQCSRAQRKWLEDVAQYGGHASILVLGPKGWAEFQVLDKVRRVTRREFQEAMQSYE